uniref:glycosyltransferase n=1 Tax=Paenibacillus glufosinatiresistens TaxID=3070657 RepID=UPI00286E1DA9
MADKATIILFSHVSNQASITGAEKLLLLLVRELAAGFDCIMAAPQEGILTRQAHLAGIRTELLPLPLLYGMYTPYPGLEQDAERLRSDRSYERLTEWLSTAKPSLVVVNTCVHALPAMAARALGIPVIWLIAETLGGGGFAEISTGLIDRYSDRILAISETAASPFPPEVRQAKLTMLPPTWSAGEAPEAIRSKLRSERRREWSVSPEQPLIGYASSFLTQEKGLEHFVHMAALVAQQRPDARFIVAGAMREASYYKRCLRKVKIEGLRSRFRFIGYEQHPAEFYCAVDILVVPSLIREGFGMTALEGLASGKPVVAYDCGGLGEILRTAGREDWLAARDHIGELAGNVLQLLADPGAAAALADDAKARVTAAYGPGAHRARVAALAADWRAAWVPVPGPTLPPPAARAPDAPPPDAPAASGAEAELPPPDPAAGSGPGPA